MEITELTIENFRPYYGEVTIKPRTEADHPLILIRGKNDTGKTSLFTAIRFCLYGAENRAEYTEHINRTAAEESGGTTRVEMTFLHDDEVYTIERGINYSQVDSADDRQAANWYREVRGPNGDIVEQGAKEQEYRRFINRILPENVAPFFLFDAEELQRFEESHDETVRESIETVLGIQEIENAVDDLNDRKRNFDREYADFESTASEVEALREELRDVMDELDEIGDDTEGEIAEIQEKIETKKANRREVRQELDKIQDTEPLRQEKQDLQEELHAAETDLQETIEQRDKLRRELGPIMAARGRQVFRDNYDIEGASGEAEVLHQIINDDDRDTCICGEPLTDEKHQQLSERYVKLHSPQRRRLTALMEICQNVDTVVSSELDRYQQYQATIRRLRQNIEDTQAEIEEIQSQIDEIEQAAKAGLKEKETQLNNEIQELEGTLNKKRERKGELTSEKQRLETRIAGMEEADSEAERYRELSTLAERCEQAFEDIKEELVESRRKSVEDHATETFLKLTNRPDYYQGIEITENYELQVKTPNATRSLEEQDPSAGQTQIIAYSFIAGLSKYTTRNAPVVIDTPIGRLDPEHKANLVDFYHEFSDQVIILYQPNELSTDDIGEMAEFIADHYEITIRDDDLSSSTIKELPDVMEAAAEVES
ncbi:AAA family ATPase [Haloterrigena alkaliphila]|uniref:AAA family ATPase n=1 Tax=Haloterrigena alkaliphila TaxID=2816475 RepID=A0A8A2VGB7_9EURY|nr:AAA family ATPase [Haloterrigena alkaliphila]QSX01100.1 AAA family ATPase [Haloterrigena alkaliphila]